MMVLLEMKSYVTSMCFYGLHISCIGEGCDVDKNSDFTTFSVVVSCDAHWSNT